MFDLQISRLFAGVPDSEIQALGRAAVLQTFHAGAVVFAQGDHGDGLYLIREGGILISALVNDQERRTLTRLGPGDFFGEMAVVDNEPRSATAIAETEATVYFIPRHIMLRLLESSPILAVNLVREFSLRFREFNRHYIREVLDTERLALVGRFARSIVHDFKNPLHVVGLAAEMAAEENASPQFRRDAAARIRNHVDRLSGMINELLEFTNNTRAEIVLAEVHYPAFIERVFEELRPDAAGRSIELLCENEPPDSTILADPSRLMHLFSNLIGNAVEALPDGGRIFLRFQLAPTEVATEIEDTGKGFAPEIVPRLFEVFATFGKAQGTGLGLSISKRIIEDHRGRIEARVAPGHGAIFRFTLPRAR